MADIGNAPGRAFDPCRRTVGIRRRRPGGPRHLGGAPATVDHPTQQIAPAFRRRAARVDEALAIEMVGDGAGVIARHGWLRNHADNAAFTSADALAKSILPAYLPFNAPTTLPMSFMPAAPTSCIA